MILMQRPNIELKTSAFVRHPAAAVAKYLDKLKHLVGKSEAKLCKRFGYHAF